MQLTILSRAKYRIWIDSFLYRLPFDCSITMGLGISISAASFLLWLTYAPLCGNSTWSSLKKIEDLQSAAISYPMLCSRWLLLLRVGVPRQKRGSRPMLRGNGSGCVVEKLKLFFFDIVLRSCAFTIGMISAIKDFCHENDVNVDMRIGIHTGIVICGIVGKKRFKVLG